MGVKFNHDVDDISRQLGSLYTHATSPYNDGWTQWACKKDLYQLKFKIDNLLTKCDTFAGEREWLTEQEKLQTWDKLKQ